LEWGVKGLHVNPPPNDKIEDLYEYIESPPFYM
jgi:hypothetical protein